MTRIAALTAAGIMAAASGAQAEEPVPPPQTALLALAGNWVGTMREVKNDDVVETCGHGTVALTMMPALGQMVGEYRVWFQNPECNKTGTLSVTLEGINIIVRPTPSNDKCKFNIQGTISGGLFSARYEAHGCDDRYIGFFDFERYISKKVTEAPNDVDTHAGA